MTELSSVEKAEKELEKEAARYLSDVSEEVERTSGEVYTILVNDENLSENRAVRGLVKSVKEYFGDAEALRRFKVLDRLDKAIQFREGRIQTEYNFVHSCDSISAARKQKSLQEVQELQAMINALISLKEYVKKVIYAQVCM